MEENVPKQEKNNFFKKVWYSVAKINKYDDMVNLGFKDSIKYFVSLLAFLTLFYAIAVIAKAFCTSTESYSIGVYIYNFLIYYLSGLIVLFIVFVFYILIMSLILFAMFKIFKVKRKFKEALSMTVYYSTLSIIIYVIYITLSQLLGFTIPRFDMITIIFMYIYLCLIFCRERRKQDGFYRKDKAKSK